MGNSTKRKLLDDSDSESDGGAPVDASFKVNEEYARRFEHNKKREEQHRLEEKLKKDPKDDDDESSSDEDEDEDGFLATEDLDAQISATLQALRSKDPKVYDSSVMFFNPDDADPSAAPKAKKEKPVFLKDYHREKLLAGDAGGSDDEADASKTFAQEQDALKKKLVSEMHAENAEDDSDSDDDDFVVKRKEPVKADANGVHPSRAAAVKKAKIAELDVEQADRDPETFLSNFMAARAWVPEEGSKWKAFDSEEEDEDNDHAETFEQAYNLRFEDPEKSNEVLKTYARDIAASRSVRREEKSGRAKRREQEKEKAEEEKRERREEKARLRKLKLDEAEAKLKKVKQAAGKVGKELRDEDWINFLDEAWDDDKWEEEMNKRFGEDYYAVNEDLDKSGDEDEDVESKKKKIKKPKWDDDIDIKDIVPDFDDEEENPKVSLSDFDQANEMEIDEEEEEEEESRPSKKRKTADIKKEKQEAQKQAKRDRSKLEALVDSKLELTSHDLLSKGNATFRYRETSPQAFGMTSRDILLAPSDSALNDFAGLKKLATFRDEEKKRRDRKTLGKKARLRQWRRDIFGREFERTGPTYGFEKFVEEHAEEEGEGARILATVEPVREEGNVVEGSRKKKKRSKGKKKVEAGDVQLDED